MKSAIILPYHVRLPMNGRTAFNAASWCEGKFGEKWNAMDQQVGTWSIFWGGVDHPLKYDWYFLNEKDLALFLLRWS